MVVRTFRCASRGSRAPARRRVAAGRRRSRRRRFVFYDALALVRDRRRAPPPRAPSPRRRRLAPLPSARRPCPPSRVACTSPRDVFLGPRRLLERPRTSPHILSLRPSRVPRPRRPRPRRPRAPRGRHAPYPNLTVPGLLRASDYFGTAVFALTGTLAAAARGMDILGCTIVGTITAVGGTVRDILGGGRRAFWMEEIEYLFICVGVSAATFLAWPRLEAAFGVRETDEWVDWADALGVGAFCVIGAQNGIRAGVPCAAAVACGCSPRTFGGVMRGVLCARPVRVLHSYADVYATTALAGATTYVLIRAAGAPVAFRILGGMGTAVALRKCAWTDDWRLPVYAGAEPNVAGGVRGRRRRETQGGRRNGDETALRRDRGECHGRRRTDEPAAGRAHPVAWMVRTGLRRERVRRRVGRAFGSRM